MSQLSHAQFPLRRHPNLLVDHRRSRSAAVAEPRGANGEAVTGSGGRLHFGMVAGIKSERWPTSNRNPRPDCLGIRNENSLREALPIYFERYLAPRRDVLARRATVERGDNLNWWDLSWSRVSWALDKRPRLVSKYFGGQGGFAPDLRAEFIVVQ